ncbi:hypothetical protein C7U57_07145 [Pseudomonas sp. R9.37]|nr:hypothetical protein C7U57_07145 [Pseudomonas sp. R9.37]
MTDNDMIKIPDLTSIVIHSRFIQRGLAREIISKRGDYKALYKISLDHNLTLQAVGYISRLDLREIEIARAN